MLMRHMILLCAITIFNFSACSVRPPGQHLTGMTSQGDIYIDEDPISVMEYKEFIYFQPDAEKAQWMPQAEEALDFLDPIDNLPKPVIGLSAEQVMAYCRWRSEIWNAKDIDARFEFRLPTTEERLALQSKTPDNFLTSEYVDSDGSYVILNLEERSVSTYPDAGQVGFRCVATIR